MNSVSHLEMLRSQWFNMQDVVGLPGFEPGSRAPEAHSLDQTSRQPQSFTMRFSDGKISVP